EFFSCLGGSGSNCKRSRLGRHDLDYHIICFADPKISIEYANVSWKATTLGQTDGRPLDEPLDLAGPQRKASDETWRANECREPTRAKGYKCIRQARKTFHECDGHEFFPTDTLHLRDQPAGPRDSAAFPGRHRETTMPWRCPTQPAFT